MRFVLGGGELLMFILLSGLLLPAVSFLKLRYITYRLLLRAIRFIQPGNGEDELRGVVHSAPDPAADVSFIFLVASSARPCPC